MTKRNGKKVRHVYIYSDGGVVNNGGKNKDKDIYGSYCTLVVLPKSQKLVKKICEVEKDVTNNVMELRGAIMGMNWILERAEEEKHQDEYFHVTIISDSQYLIKGASEWLPNWKKKGWKDASNKPIKNMDMWKYIDKILSDTSRVVFDFKWVRGHKGKSVSLEDDMDSYFNEMCDTTLSEALNPYR